MKTIAVTKDIETLPVIELLNLPDFRVVAIKPHALAYSEEIEAACPDIRDVYFYDATQEWYVCSTIPCLELHYLYSVCNWGNREEMSDLQYEMLRDANTETDIIYYETWLCDRPFDDSHRRCYTIDDDDLAAGITYQDMFEEAIEYANCNHYI